MTEPHLDPPEHDEPEHEDAARVSAIAAGVLGLAFTGVGLVASGPRTALSVALGASIAVVNLLTLRAIVGRLVPGDEAAASAGDDDGQGVTLLRDPVAEAEAEGAALADANPSLDGAGAGQDAAGAAASQARSRRGGAAWGALAIVKLVALLGILGFLMVQGWIEPLPLIVGYGVLPIGITASAVLATLRLKRGR